MPYRPIVFISSTKDDLSDHRAQAAAAAEMSGFAVSRMEYFPSSGHAPTLAACLEKVAEAEVVVVLVAHRYGWVPDGPENPHAKSITWLECDHARHVTKTEVLAFLVDSTYPWPAELRESNRVVEAMDRPRAEFLAMVEEVRRNREKLDEFKKDLSHYIRGTFTDAASVRPVVMQALFEWQRRHAAHQALPEGDPEAYLKALEDDTRQIRITGLTTRRAEPYFFRIDEIYISLTTLAGPEALRPGAVRDVEQQRRVALEQALSQRNVVILGDPGSGKSTFLRRVAFELCRTLRGARTSGAPLFLAPDDRRFPILIRVADFARVLATDPPPVGAPKLAEFAEWIAYFLGKQSEEYRWGAGEESSAASSIASIA